MKFERNTYRNNYKGEDNMMNNVYKKEINAEKKQAQFLGLDDVDFMQRNKNRNQKKSRNMGYNYENKQFSKYGIQNYINSLDNPGYDEFVA